MIDQSYIAFAYTEKERSDIEKFCCKSTEAGVFAVDTKFNICDLWIANTSYRNKRLVNTIDGRTPVHLGPIMLHFTIDEETFGRLGLEILSANPNLKNISFIGVDLTSAIFSGLKTMIPGLRRLICVHHLMKQDESKLADLLPKTGRNAADRKLSSSEIIKDIYGSRVANFYEYGIVEAIDSDDFNAKLDSLEDRWESPCPGFHQWFVRNRKSLFLESVIQSTRLNSDSTGLYYQNDIEFIHATEKHYQNFKKESIEVALSNIQKIIQREESDEIRALYGASNYCLSPEYQKFQVASHVWHSWSEERKADHLRKFREYVPNISDTFRMPANAGRKPGYQHRDRNTTEPDIVIDRTEKSNSSDSQHRARSSTISFSDPRATPEVGLKMPGKLQQTNKS